MSKISKEEFILRVNEKHPENNLDFSESTFKGLDKNITYKCSIHGEVTQLAKKVLTHTGCPICDQEHAKKKRRSGSYVKSKGKNYELQIAKELKACGYPNIVTSRSESKNTDDMKIDLIDKDNKLPVYIQIKKTKNTPNYFKIEEGCPLKDKPFVIFWSKQEVKEGQLNMSNKGEVVIIPKDFFYTLLKSYTNE